MNNQAAATSSAQAPPRVSPNLRIARFEDFRQIQRLEQAHDMETQPETDWLSLWINNPLWPRLGKNWPIGWVLEDAEKNIVGSVVNIPSLYRFKGRDLICANGRAWVCAAEFRGFAVWLMDEYFNQSNVDLFLNTTVGSNAKETIASYSTPVPVGDWQSIAYWVTKHRGFVRKALQRKNVPLARIFAQPAGAALWVKEAIFNMSIPPASAGLDVAMSQNFDPRFDSFWEELERMNPNKLLGARDSKSLMWHFGVPLRRGKVWILTASRNGLLRAYCVLKLKHYEIGLRRMQLVDYQTVDASDDLLPALIRRALHQSALAECDILEHVGCNLPKMRQIDALAPYRRAIPSWPYFYTAPDPALATELKEPAAWDPSTYDGDASFE
jgi:hypothetical protein